MTQNPSNWNTILLGSSGILGILTLAGTYASYVSKQKVDILKFKIDDLESDNTRLRKDLDEATELIETISRLQFNDEDAARIKIMSKFQEIRLLDNEFNDYKQAAQWIKDNKQDLIKEASKKANIKYPKLVPRFLGKRKHFEKDIEGYLEWLYNSLNVWGHKNVPVREFVNQPIIKSTLPYIIAIRKLKDKVDVVELTTKQSRHLKDFLDGLIKKISDESRNP